MKKIILPKDNKDYLEKLLHALVIEGYSVEEVEDKIIEHLEKMVDQTMGLEKFNSLSENWSL